MNGSVRGHAHVRPHLCHLDQTVAAPLVELAALGHDILAAVDLQKLAHDVVVDEVRRHGGLVGRVVELELAAVAEDPCLVIGIDAGTHAAVGGRTDEVCDERAVFAPDAKPLGIHVLLRHPEPTLRVDGDAIGVAHPAGHPLARQRPAAGHAHRMVEGPGRCKDLHLLRATVGDVDLSLGVERQSHRLFQVRRDERRGLAVGDRHHALP